MDWMNNINPEEFEVLDLSDGDSIKQYALKFLDAVRPVVAPLLSSHDIEWRELTALGATMISAALEDAAFTPEIHNALSMGTMFILIVGYVAAKDPELLKHVREEMRQQVGTEHITKERIEEAKENVYKELRLHTDEDSKLRRILRDIEIDLEDR